MRVVFPPGARSNAFDRNAVTRASAYNAIGVGPAALTVRWSYTVPASKKFAIGSTTSAMKVITGPTVNADHRAGFRITPSGGAATLGHGHVGANTGPLVTTGLQGEILFAGDLIEAYTIDTNTGGQHDYLLTMSGYEFDA